MENQEKPKEDKSKENMKGELSEKRDDIPHGHGAHVNEKESNAQEDYPGPDNDTDKE